MKGHTAWCKGSCWAFARRNQPGRSTLNAGGWVPQDWHGGTRGRRWPLGLEPRQAGGGGGCTQKCVETPGVYTIHELERLPESCRRSSVLASCAQNWPGGEAHRPFKRRKQWDQKFKVIPCPPVGQCSRDSSGIEVTEGHCHTLLLQY